MLLLRIDYETRLEKPVRLHGVFDERSGKAANGDGGRYRWTCVPGLAVAHHLMDLGWQVRWLGTADRMEADLVPKHGIEIDFIRISGLRGKG